MCIVWYSLFLKMEIYVFNKVAFTNVPRPSLGENLKLVWSSVNQVTYWGKGALSHNSALPDSRTPSPRCQLYGAYQTLEPCKVGYSNEIIWLLLK